jgi:sortase A
VATAVTAPPEPRVEASEQLAPPETRARRRSGERKARPPRERAPFRVNTGVVIASGLMVVTGLVALFGLFLFVGSGLGANHDQAVMYDELKKELGLATVPVNGAIPTGTPIGIVEIPELGLEQVFVEGSASEQTIHGPGLRHDTVLPGQAGASVLVARRATFGAAFADLDQLELGDRIKITTGQGSFTYIVDLVRTTDSPDVQIEQVPSRLTLVTSDPVLTPTRSLQVSARLDGDPLPATTRQATLADDLPGEGSSGRQVSLLLWAQALLLATGFTTWTALSRPGGRGLWIGAAPVLLALLWQVFENLAVLLPNTL